MFSASSEQRDLAPKLAPAAPKVSVIMPVHNTREDYFRAAVSSILNQGFPNFELIIVDDGSDAYVRDAAMSYEDSRIAFHRFDMNQGVVAARNWALDHAQGEYVAFLDSDDEAMPERLGKEASYLDGHPEAGLVYSNAEVVGDHGEALSISLFEEAPENIVARMYLDGNCICMSSVMARRSVLEGCNCRFQKKYRVAQDYAFWLSLLGKAGFAKLDERLVRYRYHSQNASHSKQHLQVSLGRRAQLDALNEALGLSLSYFLWAKMQVIKPKRLSTREIVKVLDAFCAIEQAMARKGMWDGYARSIVMSKFRNISLHSHGLAKQKAIWSHPLPKKIGVPAMFKVFCLATRLF